MSDLLKDTTQLESPSKQTGGRWRLWLYIAPFFLIPPLLLVAALLIVPSEWFVRHSTDEYFETMGYGATLRNADCKILISGDSTALVGLDPKQIQKRTGLTTCNIAETESMTVVNGTLMVDLFLQHNPPPRYLLFMYTPEGMNPTSQRSNPFVTTFEPVTFRFRQPDKIASFFALMHHPEDVFSWTGHGLHAALWAASSKETVSPEMMLRRYTSLGQLAMPEPDLTNCNYAPADSVPNKAWMQNLRDQYSRNGTVVLLDATPVPTCDPQINYFKEKLNGLIDNGIQTLPPSDYQLRGRHVNSAGVMPLSNMIADQILSRMNSETASKER